MVNYLKSAAKTLSYEQHIYHGSALILCVIFSFLTWQRNLVWRSGKEFWANVIQNAPYKARAYNNYGVAIAEAGDIKGSIPYYQKAISMDAFYPDPLNNIAVAFSTIGELDKAIGALQQGIRLQPNYPEAYNNLASFLIMKKDYPQAEQALNIALQLRPFYGKAWLNKCKLYAETGKQELAFEAARNCCTKADLDNEVGYTLYAQVSFSMQKWDDAIFAYNKLMEIKPTAETMLSLANAYLLSDNLTKAEQMYLQLLKATNNKDARAWYNLGETYAKTNQLEQALKCFTKVQELNYPLNNLPIRIAQCLQQLGRHVEAKPIFESILNNPAMPEQFKTIAQTALAQPATKPQQA